jgi:hypothetical protein
MRCLAGIGWHLLVGCFFLCGCGIDAWANVAPIARNDSVRVEQNGKINIDVLGDFDGDGGVGFADFVLFATRFGLENIEENFDKRMDFDGDGRIAFSDFLRFIGLFGKTPTGG